MCKINKNGDAYWMPLWNESTSILSLYTMFLPKHACAMKPEVLICWSLEIDYSRAPCLGDDQKTRGLWERDCRIINNLVPRAHVPFAFKIWYCYSFKAKFDFPSFSMRIECHRLYLTYLWTSCCKPRYACAVKPELLKSWSLEMDYYIAPCFSADHKTRGLWERDCLMLPCAYACLSHKWEPVSLVRIVKSFDILMLMLICPDFPTSA